MHGIPSTIKKAFKRGQVKVSASKFKQGASKQNLGLRFTFSPSEGEGDKLFELTSGLRYQVEVSDRLVLDKFLSVLQGQDLTGLAGGMGFSASLRPPCFSLVARMLELRPEKSIYEVLGLPNLLSHLVRTGLVDGETAYPASSKDGTRLYPSAPEAWEASEYGKLVKDLDSPSDKRKRVLFLGVPLTEGGDQGSLLELGIRRVYRKGEFVKIDSLDAGLGDLKKSDRASEGLEPDYGVLETLSELGHAHIKERVNFFLKEGWPEVLLLSSIPGELTKSFSFGFSNKTGLCRASASEIEQAAKEYGERVFSSDPSSTQPTEPFPIEIVLKSISRKDRKADARELNGLSIHDLRQSSLETFLELLGFEELELNALGQVSPMATVGSLELSELFGLGMLILVLNSVSGTLVLLEAECVPTEFFHSNAELFNFISRDNTFVSLSLNPKGEQGISVRPMPEVKAKALSGRKDKLNLTKDEIEFYRVSKTNGSLNISQLISLESDLAELFSRTREARQLGLSVQDFKFGFCRNCEASLHRKDYSKEFCSECLIKPEAKLVSFRSTSFLEIHSTHFDALEKLVLGAGQLEAKLTRLVKLGFGQYWPAFPVSSLSTSSRALLSLA